MSEKTHYRKAFDSPYLSSSDVVEPIKLTIRHVRLEKDHTKRTQDVFNTAYFVEPEIRRGEKLKPMILNAGNCKTMKTLTGSPYIDDWENVAVTIYVDGNVRFGRETVEGLRISPHKPEDFLISAKQAADLRALADEVGADNEKFLRYLKADSFESIQVSSFQRAVAALEAKRKQS